MLLQLCCNFKDAITMSQQRYSNHVYPLACFYSKCVSDKKKNVFVSVVCCEIID